MDAIHDLLLGQYYLILSQGALFLRLLVATGLGGLLGWERERRDRPAGLRTFMLVSLGSCLFTILSVEAFPDSESSRLAANVLTGIGFIGAGTVFRQSRREEPEVTGAARVRGLTTAAGLWAAAGIGMAAGVGFCWLALFSTLLAYIMLTVFRRLERHNGD